MTIGYNPTFEARAGREGGERLGRGQRARLGIYEGALSFVTEMFCTYRDSPYKREWGKGICQKALVSSHRGVPGVGRDPGPALLVHVDNLPARVDAQVSRPAADRDQCLGVRGQAAGRRVELVHDDPVGALLADEQVACA